nr:helix-turn-helix transcriptional regulator [Micromonospora sp. DSM 115978]
MARPDWIGLRVARWRDIAGMTQVDLAERVGVTGAYISMIESGKRPLTKRSLLIEIASALGVSITDLTGQPGRPRTRDDWALWTTIPALRGALDDDPDDGPGRTAEQLAAAADRAAAARMACDYRALADLLPGLVVDARRLADSEDPAGYAALVRAAVTTALAIKPFGYLDLSSRFAERAELAATRLGRPIEQAAAAFAVAQCALGSGTAGGRARSLAIATRHADALGDTGDNDTVTWYGLLRLHAGLSAAALDRADDADAHLNDADAAARRIIGDPWHMEFGPANVGIWRVGAALENGRPDLAPVYARRVDRSAVRTAHRRARLHIDAGRGLWEVGDPAGAVAQFLEADHVSPQELRSRPSVRELVGQMVRDARRRGSDELRELAVRVGVDPLDPDHDHT